VNAEDDYRDSQGLRLNVNVKMNDSFMDASMASQSMAGSAGFGAAQGRDLDRGTGVLSEASFHSPLKFKQRVFRRTSGQVGGGDVGATWFVDAPPPEIPHPLTSTGMQASLSTVTEGDRCVGLPDYNFNGHAAAASRASAVGLEIDAPPPSSKIVDAPNVFSANSAASPPSRHEVVASSAATSGMSNFLAFVPRTVQELEEYLHLAPNEDVLSILSRRSVHSDPTVHWVPFSILPDAAIARLLCCSLLSITSPSFGPIDAHRIAHVVAASRNRLWAHLRALSVYETRLGDAGILTLLSLPAPALKAISFSNTGCSHRIPDFIGKSLVGQESPFEVSLKLLRSLSASGHGRNATFQSLVKITFEDEPHLGDRGAVELMQLLQYNGTVRHIVLRRCGLGLRSASQLSQFLGLSESIRTVNLNGNAMDSAAVLKLMRTMGSMGMALSHEEVLVSCTPIHSDCALRLTPCLTPNFSSLFCSLTLHPLGNKGPFRHLHIAGQEPSLSLECLKDLKLAGIELGLDMDVPSITAAMESAEYLRRQLDAEEEGFARVQKSFDQLASSEAAFGRGFKRLAAASFLKHVHL
jgi:hypothetical protein